MKHCETEDWRAGNDGLASWQTYRPHTKLRMHTPTASHNRAAPDLQKQQDELADAALEQLQPSHKLLQLRGKRGVSKREVREHGPPGDGCSYQLQQSLELHVATEGAAPPVASADLRDSGG